VSIFEKRKDASEAARRQALFRGVNEQLRGLNEAFESVTRDSEFICECANTSCMEHVTMTVAEYDAVRRFPTRFLVLPTHVLPEVERIAAEHDLYVVVEKVGAAGKAAARLDPRAGRRDSG
jgi:hypothetical protein